MDRLTTLLMQEVDGGSEGLGEIATEDLLSDMFLSTPRPKKRPSVAREPPPVIVLGATRDLALLEPALVREGRLDVHIQLAPPSVAERTGLLARMLRRTPVLWEEEAEAAAPPVPAVGADGRAGGGLSLIHI